MCVCVFSRLLRDVDCSPAQTVEHEVAALKVEYAGKLEVLRKKLEAMTVCGDQMCTLDRLNG